MALIKVDGLCISFYTREGVTQAVKHASFEINRGDTLCIVGESGSGKSVLCSSLMGLLPANTARIVQGHILLDDVDIAHASEPVFRKIRGNRISMIFQDPMTSLNPYLTIGTQVIEPLQVHRNFTKNEAIPEALATLDEVGLKNPEKLMKRYPHELSGGMRQRVMIAMALINKPDILIADEPTTALDVTIQSQILKLIKKIQNDRHFTVIFVSHDLGVVSGIADYILVMQEGRIVEEGTPDRIFYRTQHPYTKNLLASIPQSAKPPEYRFKPADTSGPLVRIRNLKTYFTDNRSARPGSRAEITKAVDDVTFDIHTGETLGLVGESGSGKTTLGRSVMRLVNITDGRITLANRDVTALSGSLLRRSRREFQMIFQDPYASLNPRMTVFDTLAEAVRIKDRVSDLECLEKVHDLMRQVGLQPGQIRKYPHEFSGGQRQRIAIARAIAMNPRLIIADEPVSALDVTIQAQILKLLLDLVKRKRLTMLFISHDLSVVRYMSDRIAVMTEGKIVELGETESVFKHPSHPYTQSLLAAVPVPDPESERGKYSVAQSPGTRL